MLLVGSEQTGETHHELAQSYFAQIQPQISKYSAETDARNIFFHILHSFVFAIFLCFVLKSLHCDHYLNTVVLLVMKHYETFSVDSDKRKIQTLSCSSDVSSVFVQLHALRLFFSFPRDRHCGIAVLRN